MLRQSFGACRDSSTDEGAMMKPLSRIPVLLLFCAFFQRLLFLEEAEKNDKIKLIHQVR